jgi:hypothetical protein
LIITIGFNSFIVILVVFDNSFLRDKMKIYSEVGGEMIFKGFDTAPFFKTLNRFSVTDVIWFKQGPEVRDIKYESSSTLILKTIDI